MRQMILILLILWFSLSVNGQSQFGILSDTCSLPDTVFRIEVVFHVVYVDSTQNIGDSLIYSQLEVLNEDYNKKNADTALIRSVFASKATKVGFEFVLATNDHHGNPTNGITRTSSTAPSSGFLPGADLVVYQFPGTTSACVKRTANKGADPWPTNRYLNVWVCKVNGAGTPLKAYAYPPANAGWQNLQPYQIDSSLQGVVIDYTLVGRNNFGGRTLTHEIGHYFGIKHLHGQSGGCGDDDGFSDTPKQSASSGSVCDTTTNTCVDSPTDLPDHSENFMDDNIANVCKFMFTTQQAAFMRQIARNQRAGVAVPSICIPSTVGFEKNTSISKLLLFPNPTSGVVRFEDKGSASIEFVEVADAVGSRVATSYFRNSELKDMDVSFLPNGVYMLQIKTTHGWLMKKLLVAK